MAYVNRFVEDALVDMILRRYPKAEGFEDATWYNGACEILFYPHPRAVEPYAAIFKNGSYYILQEF